MALLGQNFTPARVLETAKLRVARAEDRAIAAELEAMQGIREQGDPLSVAVAAVRMNVIEALDRGGTLFCPQCGTRVIKDDACIHMDLCRCRSSWCFLCGRLEGRGEGHLKFAAARLANYSLR